MAAGSSISAAAVSVSAVRAGTAAWTVNGTPVALSTIDSGGYKLYSLSQVAGEIGAKLLLSSNGFALNDSQGLHTVQLQTGTASYLVDGDPRQFAAAPVVYNGRVYVELTSLVTALGGELSAEDQTILSFARPEGQFDTLHWTAAGSIIANKSDSDTAQLLKFSAYPGVYEWFSSNESALDFSVSADQKWGAFTDETGQLKLISLSSGAVSSLGTDTSVKTDLVWSQDGKKIYFIQGDKQEKIAWISVETGVVTPVLQDKVENKSELRLSSDEESVVYIVNVTGVAKNDADSTEDSLTVDFSKAGEQLYKLALTTEDAEPEALTTALDNKLYPEILANDTVVYLSADPDGNAANTLKSIGTDGAITDIVLDVEVFWSAAVASGLVVSGTAADGSTTIYSIDASGSTTVLFHTDEEVSEVAVSQDGSKLAFVSDGKVFLIQNGTALQLTQ